MLFPTFACSFSLRQRCETVPTFWKFDWKVTLEIVSSSSLWMSSSLKSKFTSSSSLRAIPPELFAIIINLIFLWNEISKPHSRIYKLEPHPWGNLFQERRKYIPVSPRASSKYFSTSLAIFHRCSICSICIAVFPRASSQYFFAALAISLCCAILNWNCIDTDIDIALCLLAFPNWFHQSFSEN